MSFSPATSPLVNRGAQLDSSMSRTQILGRTYQPFANPFFDQASTYLPPTVKALFTFCRHFHLTHGIINAVNTKSSEYPITDIIWTAEEPQIARKYEELFMDQLNYPVSEYEINLDLNVYGNAFVSVGFPFRKQLQCSGCRVWHDAVQTRTNWRYALGKFWLNCPKCYSAGYARAKDEYIRKLSEITIQRWNPELISIFENEVTGRIDYVLDLSQGFRAQILMGRKDLVATTPEVFLEAVHTRRQIVFDPSEIFHFRRPSLSMTSKGWGIPSMMPVLKDAYYMQIMKKANEAILLQHILPQIFLFPQPSTNGADPYVTANLADWRDHIRREIARQRVDPAYYGILPFPIGHQVIGENGRSLLLMPEIQQMAEQICVGMGFPVNLVFGDGTYAGSSVAMRMLENYFLGNVRGHRRLLRWVIGRIAAFLNWPRADARFKPFRMADDLQRQAFMFSLNQAKKISDTTLLAQVDIKIEDELRLRMSESAQMARVQREEQVTAAEVASDAGVVMAKGQARAQEVMAEAQARAMTPKTDLFQSALSSSVGSGSSGVPLESATLALAEAVRGMPEPRKSHYMRQLESNMPEVAQLIQQQVALGGAPDPTAGAMGGAQPGMGMMGAGVDMTPQPNVLPPRRAGGV